MSDELKRFSDALARFERWMVYVACGLIFFLMVVVSSEIIARRLRHPIPGQFELAEIFFALIVFLGVAYTQSERGHVNMDLLTSHLKGRTRDAFELTALIIALVAFIFMFWQTLMSGIQSFEIGEYTPGAIFFPIWPAKLVVPLAILVLDLRIFVQIWQVVSKIRAPMPMVSKMRAPMPQD